MADLGELGDLTKIGDLGDLPDPLGGGGVEGVVDEISNTVSASLKDVNIPAGVPPDVIAQIPEFTPPIIELSVKEIPTTADGIAGKQIQVNALDSIEQNASLIHSNAIEDALVAKGGDPARITADDLKNSYAKEVDAKVNEAKANFKAELSTAVDQSLAEVGGKSGDLVNSLVEDPAGAEAKLTADGEAIEKADPNWKDTIKQKLGSVGEKILSYGGKALLVLAVIGAIIPGADGPINKIAKLAGEAAGKVATVAAGIVTAFFGPIVSQIEGVFAKLKWPLIFLFGLIVIFMIAKVVSTLRGN